MRTALITTTINVPKVLALYRKLGPDVGIFVAGDKKSPHEAICELAATRINGDFLYMSPDFQTDWKCSELIGWNNDSRRNIALLEAVKWGADIIVSIDDDVIPLGLDFFERFEIMMSEPYSGLELGSPGLWCDAGQQTIVPAAQRGLPLGLLPDNSGSFVHNINIGAMQGIILGIPDTDAGTTIAKCPFVHSATDILRNGFVIDPQAKSVFNSQVTAFRRELAPCFAQFYKWQGRNTDIFASLIMRRVMRAQGLHTYFGPPFVYHNRSPRDPKKDLEAEHWGTENVVKFSKYLDETAIQMDDTKESMLGIVRSLYVNAPLDAANIECALAFLDDMEGVL